MDIPGIDMDRTGLIDRNGLAEAFIMEWESEDDYIVAHTSGSTGTPKRIMLRKDDMAASAKATCRFFGINGASLLYLPLSLDYIAGKMMAVRAIVSGARLQVVPPSIDPLPEQPAGRIALLPIVPSQAGALLQSEYLHMVDNVIVGGAPLDVATESRLAGCSAKIYATYGMTETCSHVALRNVSAGEKHFTAIPGVSFGTDARGCLTIDSEIFSFGRLVTNDVVDLIDPTRFVWLGRADNVINSGGVKCHPEEIEAGLSAAVGDRAFYITCRPSVRWGEELVMVVEGEGFDAQAFYEAASSLVGRRQLPKAVMWTQQFERTSSGKIKRVKNPEGHEFMTIIDRQ